MKTTVFGTCHFPSFDAAVRYYMPYEGNNLLVARQAVFRKLDEGSIRIGEPSLKPGQEIFLDWDEERYFIREVSH